MYCWVCVDGRRVRVVYRTERSVSDTQGELMYIGVGAVVVILIVLLLIGVLR
jgi:hypothetical protein